MRTSTYAIIWGVLLFLSVTVFIPASSAVNLSNSPSRLSEYAFVMPFDNDKVMVVWDEKEGFYNLYYRVFANGYWGPKTRIYNTTMNSQWPQLAKDSQGRIHMTWMEGSARSNRDIFYAYYSGGKWSAMQKIYASAWNSTWPRIGVDDRDVPHIIWTHDRGEARGDNEIYHRWKNGGWLGPLDVSRSVKTISIHSNLFVRGSNQYALWMDGHECAWNLHFSQTTNGKWNTPIHINPKIQGYWPGICADSKGNVHILFSSLLRNVYYMNRIDGEWSDWRVVSNGPHPRNFVYIDVDDNDILHGVWRQTDGGSDQIYYGSATSQGIWAEPFKISNGRFCKTPIVKPDNNGYVHVVWFELNDETETGDVYYIKGVAGEGGSADAPIAIFTATPEFGKPPLDVVFKAGGSYDPDGTIVKFEWNFGDGTTATGIQVSHRYTKKGAYIATLKVKDNDGLTGVEQINILVSDPPAAVFTMTPQRGVAPVTVQFDASASNDPDGSIVLYSWDFGDNTTGKGKTTAHTYDEEGNYTIMLEVFDNVGISAIVTRILEVLRVYGPNNIEWKFVENRNLFFREYIYDITWEKNPLNQQYGISVKQYNVYRKHSGSTFYEKISSVPPDQFNHMDRGLNENDGGRYEYTVTAVDSQGNESVRQLAGVSGKPGGANQKANQNKKADHAEGK